MNVLLVNKFFRRGAGAETVFFDTMALLDRGGHTVVPFAMQHEDNEPTPWSEYFARRRDYLSGSITGRVRDAAASVYSLEARSRLRELLRVFRPDIAHLHNVYHQLTLSVIDELEAAGVPIVLTVHDYKPVCPNYQLLANDGPCTRCIGGAYRHALIHRCVKGSFVASGVAALEAHVNRLRNQYGKIDRLISPSVFLRDVLVEGGYQADRIDVIANPVQPSSSPRSSTTAPTFIYFGRLAPEKGLQTLLDAAALLDGAARIVIYGTGPLEDEVRTRVEHEQLPVDVRGFAAQAEIFAALGDMRAALLPARWFENCPMSILEAAACGVPTIGSRIGGIPDLIDDGRTGVLVEPGDPAGLAEAINGLAGNEETARRLGAAARELIAERHDRLRYRDSLLAVYRRAMGEPVTGGLAAAS